VLLHSSFFGRMGKLIFNSSFEARITSPLFRLRPRIDMYSIRIRSIHPSFLLSSTTPRRFPVHVYLSVTILYFVSLICFSYDRSDDPPTGANPLSPDQSFFILSLLFKLTSSVRQVLCFFSLMPFHWCFIILNFTDRTCFSYALSHLPRAPNSPSLCY
jgi:hypothetical protein